MSGKNHEFIIKFEGVNLSKEASDHLQNGINKLVQQAVGMQGSIVGSADDGDDYCGIYIPHKWIGRQVLVANFSRLQDQLKDQTLGSAVRLPASFNKQ